MAPENLRQTILKNAHKLFKRHGYRGTTLKQIAAASGCTPPALYYFFEGGKAELLTEVLRAVEIDPEVSLRQVVGADTFSDLLERLNIYLPQALQAVIDNLCWLYVDVQNLPSEAQHVVLTTHEAYGNFIFNECKRFIPDEEEASRQSWFILSLYTGFIYLFSRMRSEAAKPITTQELGEMLKEHYERYLPTDSKSSALIQKEH
jgi:AcrR family transcriptional regulator